MEGSLLCLKITIHLRRAHQPAFERMVRVGGSLGGREWRRPKPKCCQSNELVASLLTVWIHFSAVVTVWIHLSTGVCSVPPYIVSSRFGFSESLQRFSVKAWIDSWQVLALWCLPVFWQLMYGGLSIQLRAEKALVFLPFFVFTCGETIHKPKHNPFSLICFGCVPFLTEHNVLNTIWSTEPYLWEQPKIKKR